MKRWIGSAVAGICVATLGACGGGGAGNPASSTPAPTPAPGDVPTASQAENAVNDAIVAALDGGTAVTVTDNHSKATLDGTISADGVTLTFSHLDLAKKPFSANGSVTVDAGSHSASISFAQSTTGSYVVDGSSEGTVLAKIPMVNEFVQGTASWAIHEAFAPHAMTMPSNGGNGQGSGACNVTVTDDGNGGFVIDGSCTVCNATVTFTMFDFNPTAMTINGTIAIDDGNGDTATLTFNGTTVDVTVNGQDLGTFDLSQIL